MDVCVYLLQVFGKMYSDILNTVIGRSNSEWNVEFAKDMLHCIIRIRTNISSNHFIEEYIKYLL